MVVSRKPGILSCQFGAESDKGEVGNSTLHGDSENEESTFINFQPKSMSFKFDMEFKPPDNVSTSYPNHINESLFGIVKAKIRLYKENVNSTFNYHNKGYVLKDHFLL